MFPKATALTNAETENANWWEIIIDEFLRKHSGVDDIVFQLWPYSNVLFDNGLSLPSQRVREELKSRYLADGWIKIEWKNANGCMKFSVREEPIVNSSDKQEGSCI